MKQANVDVSYSMAVYSSCLSIQSAVIIIRISLSCVCHNFNMFHGIRYVECVAKHSCYTIRMLFEFVGKHECLLQRRVEKRRRDPEQEAKKTYSEPNNNRQNIPWMFGGCNRIHIGDILFTWSENMMWFLANTNGNIRFYVCTVRI